jgi:hypothetical protein
MKYRWDTVNKWFHMGDNWVLMFNNWMGWKSIASMNEWSLFRILWNNGAWWAFDLDNVIILNGKKKGYLECFWQIELIGIGIRKYYKKLVEIRVA